MARAIKHIKAGILHIEVLGQIPEPGERKRRAARCRSTSAAQAFYNAKASWRELELMIAANFAASDWVITYTYDNAHLPSCREEASKELQKYFRRLRTARRRRGDDLLYIYNIEGYHGSEGQDGYISAGPLEDRRIHHHVILNGCGPGDLDELRSLWRGGGYVRAERLDIHYYRELAKYMTKEAREFGTPRPGERTWRDISTGSSEIDKLLLGGFKCGTVTEISGRGSTGKTQLVITACATAQRYNTPSHQFQCIVIDAENTYSAIRQQEVLTNLKNPNASLRNIFVWKPQSLAELIELLKSLPTFLEQHPQVRNCQTESWNQVKFIAIDSIAYYFRQFTDMIERSSKLNEAISYLTKIANRMQCAVRSMFTIH